MVGVLGFCWIMSRSSRRVCSETWVAPFIRYCFFAATQRQCHSTWGVPQFFRNQRTFRIATRVQTNTRIIQILNFGNVVVLLESSRVRDLPHTLSEFWDNHATSKERAGFLKTKNRKSDNSRNKKKNNANKQNGRKRNNPGIGTKKQTNEKRKTKAILARTARPRKCGTRLAAVTLDKALERTRRTRIASQSVPEFQPMWCQFTTVTSNKGAATDLELTRANRTTRCMYECFTDHTLAHPLNCRGRVVAALTTIEIWRKWKLKPGPLSSNKFVTSYFFWVGVFRTDAGLSAIWNWACLLCGSGPGSKTHEIGDDNCVHHDVERAQTTQ